MPNLIPEEDIQEIISNFSDDITEYEIVNIDNYQGWSSTHLYLIVALNSNFILKAKTRDQISGYDVDVTISKYLIEKDIPARRPLLTKSGEIFYKQGDFFWCLMTYITGATSHVNEYTPNTIKSLAKFIDTYVTVSGSSANINQLNLKPCDYKKNIESMGHLMSDKDLPKIIEKINLKNTSEIYNSLMGSYEDVINGFKVKSLIHNDISPNNILIDHRTKKVISLIDWDHGCYGNPIKDVCDAVSIFYDHLSLNKATENKNLFYNALTSPWFTQISSKKVELAFMFYYTVSKWQTISFYLNLLKKYDNKYGEKDRFMNEIKQAYNKWLNVVTNL